jgi:hypothetical protein
VAFLDAAALSFLSLGDPDGRPIGKIGSDSAGPASAARWWG